MLLNACGGATPAPTVAVGEELPAAAAAEQDTAGSRVAISERELKSAERAARRAEARRKQAQNASNRNQQRPNDAPTEPDEPADPDAPAPTADADEELPRDPTPPETVSAPADVAVPPADAVKTASGLFSKVLQKGRGGPLPTPGSKVVVHYSGWTTDGRLFDSSVVRGQPVRLPLAQVIPGWREGVMLMTVGEKRRLWVPEKLAYQGKSGAPAGMLVFDVELLRIE